MAMNLEQHRAQPSVWDGNRRADWNAQRWMAALLAGVLAASGWRRRSAPGFLMVLGAGGLAWWAAGDADERRAQLNALRGLCRGSDADEVVHEAAEESFPASDAPSWTSTTGATASERRVTGAR